MYVTLTADCSEPAVVHKYMMLLLLLLFITAVLYTLYSWITIKPQNFPPGPPTVPFLGSAPFLPAKNIHFEMEKWNKKYGGIVGLVLGSKLGIAVCCPKLVREVLKRDEFQGRPINDRLKDRSFGRRIGITFSDGQEWQEQRRFTVRHLKNFGFGKTSMEGIILEEISEIISEIKDQTIQVSNLFNLSSINVLWSVVAGVRYKHSDPNLLLLMKHMSDKSRAATPLRDILNLFPFLRHVVPDKYNIQKQVVNEMHSFLLDVIKQHEETIDENNPRDFIDEYLSEMHKCDKNSSYDVETLVTICSDLFTAGSESVGNSIGFAVLYMTLYPEIQRRVHAEIDDNIGCSRKPSLHDRANLPYVEAVLLEIQRCNTIAPLTIPHRATINATLNGYFIPKDSLMLLSLWSIMQDKHHWGDPHTFRPSRFIDENGKVIKDDFIIPFGTGKRSCPGEALARNILFLFFTSLMQEFSIHIPPGHKEPSTMCLSGFTTAPQPFEVIFKLR